MTATIPNASHSLIEPYPADRVGPRAGNIDFPAVAYAAV
jgi:hypothetical protein